MKYLRIFEEYKKTYQTIHSDNETSVAYWKRMHLGKEEQELLDSFKFHLDDYVMVIADILDYDRMNWKNGIFKIVAIELYQQSGWKYCLDENRDIWAKDDEIRKLTDVELDAIKYNL